MNNRIANDLICYAELVEDGALISPEEMNCASVMRLAAEYLVQPEHSATQQEPVATLDDLEQEIYENTRQFVSRDVMEWMLKRYYTTPPQRKPLTDEQMKKSWYSTKSMMGWYSFQEVTRCIEAAHGIKE